MNFNRINPVRTDSLAFTDQETRQNDTYRELFSDANLNKLQTIIRRKLQKELNKDIAVTHPVISQVLYENYSSHRPEIGDPFTFLRKDTLIYRNDIRDIEDRTVSLIVSHIKNEYLVNEQNSKLTVWNTVLGSHNAAGLQRFSNSGIKLNRRKIPFRFNMRY